MQIDGWAGATLGTGSWQFAMAAWAVRLPASVMDRINPVVTPVTVRLRLCPAPNRKGVPAWMTLP